MVLNGRTRGTVSAANQKKVLDAAAELGYTRSAVAMSLRERRTRTIGLISDEIATSPWAGRMVRAASMAAAERGYMMITADLSLPELTLEEAVKVLSERQVDGLLYGAMGRTRLAAPGVPAGTPLVLMNCEEGDQSAPAPRTEHSPPAVIPDDRQGARRAARRLLDVGHRRVVMLSGDDTAVATREREEGFVEEVAAAGLAPRVVRAGWQMDDGYRATTALLAQDEPPTALFCIRDRVAAGAIHAAAVAGLAVPQDLSVIGYDDEDFFAEVLTPPLTTIALPHEEMGRHAMDTLLDLVERSAPAPAPGLTVAECPLVERASVAAPPRG
ncbi:LacI family transcriptional regulator [Brachybacterium saurashtrense]|uniref:LacI family transcriptional regulator n=2 Tax=Brachybacterium saurashtrense TaxID=556288 RepID=A0A345YTT5_9MICO|nr:LacI family transcriptional regulator [Brachybacterium saurashtrense]RRR20928.1 LacI family transcriptional regulator [Brachybacterium saurashtrense]